MKRIFVAAIVLAPIVACKPGPRECTKTKLMNDYPSFWMVSMTNCGDGKKYGVTCAPDPALSGFSACSCAVDGVATKTFQYPGEIPSDDTSSLKAILNASCSWQVD